MELPYDPAMPILGMNTKIREERKMLQGNGVLRTREQSSGRAHGAKGYTEERSGNKRHAGCGGKSKNKTKHIFYYVLYIKT